MGPTKPGRTHSAFGELGIGCLELDPVTPSLAGWSPEHPLDDGSEPP